VYAGLGDKDEAIKWLEKDVERGSGDRLMFLKWWFTFDELRTDPQYLSIVNRIGLAS